MTKLQVYPLIHTYNHIAYFTKELLVFPPNRGFDWWLAYKLDTKSIHGNWIKLIEEQAKLIDKPLFNLVCPPIEIEALVK